MGLRCGGRDFLHTGNMLWKGEEVLSTKVLSRVLLRETAKLGLKRRAVIPQRDFLSAVSQLPGGSCSDFVCHSIEVVILQSPRIHGWHDSSINHGISVFMAIYRTGMF